MKKLTLLILLLSTTLSFTQTESYKKYLVAGKWAPAYKIKKGEKTGVYKGEKGKKWISFFKNGKYQAYRIKKIEGVDTKVKGEEGTWEILEDKTKFIFKPNNHKRNDTITIESITEKEMIIYDDSAEIKVKQVFKNINMELKEKNDLPYYEIEEAPKEYTAGAVAGRMVDGLGFRYYWATESLRDEDLAYKPSKEGRTTGETIDHILGLSHMILNATLNVPNGKTQTKLTFTEKRKRTLKNFKKASDILKESKDLSKLKIIFGERKIDFWNAINGPIADATWHVGQIVSFRRSSGNPLPSGVSFLTGKKK